jgi:actin-related protein
MWPRHPEFFALSKIWSGTDCFVGHEAVSKAGILRLRKPVAHGVVRGEHWNDMETIWRHCFVSELRVAPEEHAVLLAEPQHNPRGHREKTAQIMFETFGVPALHLASQAQLSLAAAGRRTGVVVETGHGVTAVVPFYEGEAVSHAVTDVSVTGSSLAVYLNKMLEDNRGMSFIGSTRMEMQLNDCKEKLCFVSIDAESDRAHAQLSSEFDKMYEYEADKPWGFFVMGKERFECPEALFDPSVSRADDQNLHATWKKVRLLWIGRADEGSVFYNAPRDVLRLIQNQCVEKQFFRSLRTATNAVAIHDAVHNCIRKCDIDRPGRPPRTRQRSRKSRRRRPGRRLLLRRRRQR